MIDLSKLSDFLRPVLHVVLSILWILYVVRLLRELRGNKFLAMGIITIIVLIALAFLCVAADLLDWAWRLVVLAMAAFVLFTLFIPVQRLRELSR